MEKGKLTNPYNLIAAALNCDKETLNEDSAITIHPMWDSLTQIAIVVAIEKEYKVVIKDDEVMKYSSLLAINELYEQLDAQK